MGIWTILGGIVIGLMSSLLAVEIADRSGQFSSWLIRRAVKRLPAELQTLHEEAWLADVRDKAGRLGRIVFAAGLITAASKMSHDLRLPNVKFQTACVIRALDIVAAGFIIIFFAPLLLSTVIGYWLTGIKPIFTRTQRVGLNGERFYIYKFNTIEYSVIPEGASPNTRYKNGRSIIFDLLRTARIDKMPQTFSVLIGDMSFVGPRPEHPGFVDLAEKKIPNYSIRQKIKPGLIGWAQVICLDRALLDDAKAKLRYDREAVELYSVRYWFKCCAIALWRALGRPGTS